MIIWTPAVLSVLYARVLCFCICTCSAQLSMFHMERRSRNILIVIIIIIRSNRRDGTLTSRTQQWRAQDVSRIGKTSIWFRFESATGVCCTLKLQTPEGGGGGGGGGGTGNGKESSVRWLLKQTKKLFQPCLLVRMMIWELGDSVGWLVLYLPVDDSSTEPVLAVTWTTYHVLLRTSFLLICLGAKVKSDTWTLLCPLRYTYLFV